VCLAEDGLHLGQQGAGLLEMSAVARRLREISDRPAALYLVPGWILTLERADQMFVGVSVMPDA
jgi:hypothetical protein